MKNWLITIAVVLCFTAIAAIFVFAHYSRSIDVGSKTIAGTAAATSSAMGAAPSSTLAIATTTEFSAASYTSTIPTPPDFTVNISSTFAFPTSPIDTTVYDAKMLAIANLPAPYTIKTTITTTTLSSTGTPRTVTTTFMKTIQPATGWPVKNAPYPIPGAILPYDRIVAYYGNLYSTQMGVLGEYPAPQMLAMLASTTAMWQAADTSTPVVPALDYIVVTAQGSPGADGKYRLRMPESQIDQILTMANQVHGIVFLDVQVGLSNVETEVPLLEPYLKLPQVELSLDPEFAMHDGEAPGTVIGTMDASDINWAANYLATLVQQYNLPPKILTIHRFTDDMVTHTSQIKPLPQVQIVMDMDGFGFPAKKINTYEQVVDPFPVQFTGFKLFYKNDAAGALGHLMTPSEVLKLSPQPSYIQYQ